MEQTIVFIGGIKGAGKTTVTRKAKEIHPELEIFKPADLFDLYCQTNPIIAPPFIEKMVAEGIKGLRKPVALIDWHYAIQLKDGFIPHVDWCLLKDIAQEQKNADFIFFLIDLDKESALKHRLKDYQRKKRILKLEIIEKELSAEKIFFNKTVSIFKEYSDNIVKSHIIRKDTIDSITSEIINTLLNLPTPQ